MNLDPETHEITGTRAYSSRSSAARLNVVHGLGRLLSSALTLLALVAPMAVASGFLLAPVRIVAQAAAHQLGTVTSVTGSTIALQSAAGVAVTVTLDPAATVLKIPPGSKSLQDATAATLADVAVGDRVLATGTAGSGPATLTASRVIVMKAGALEALKSSQQADWRRNGVSGLVRGIEGPSITISAALHTIKVETTSKTIFRRYTAGSVSFSAARPGTLAEIQVGDQMSVRGNKSVDGTEVTADEIVSGTFQNLSGAIGSINVQAQTLTLKDLATKKPVTVQIAPGSDLRSLPAQAARAFSVRNQTEAHASPAKTDAAAEHGDAGSTRRAGMDLSRMLPHLPQEKLSDLKAGDAVLIVASQAEGGGPLTAITLLSGVEQLLSANSDGSQAITLSPWSLDAPEGGTP